MTPSDERIIQGFCTFNEHITKEYFYGYVRKAYDIMDHRYQLRGKPGLDFYSLAHEYYISLLSHNFRPLTDKPENVKLSTHMVNGFRFVVLDALKAYNKEFKDRSECSADEVLSYVRSSYTEERMLPQIASAVSSHYHDRAMQEIGHMIFYMGYKQKEVAEHLHMTPSAVNQRYKKMMDEVVTPFVIENYGYGISDDTVFCHKTSVAPCKSSVPESMFESQENFAMLGGMGMSFSLSRKQEDSTPSKPTKRERRTTPYHVSSLAPNQVFVFGSNLQGMHAGGAAKEALDKYGAVYGQGVGMQGQSYAIPTMQGGVETIRPYVDEFIKYATEHPEQTFLVTEIGCGLAGFDPWDIAPLFRKAEDIDNIHLPDSFWHRL